jgi:hypothetical protein
MASEADGFLLCKRRARRTRGRPKAHIRLFYNHLHQNCPGAGRSQVRYKNVTTMAFAYKYVNQNIASGGRTEDLHEADLAKCEA